jgi:hypothetical protein
VHQFARRVAEIQGNKTKTSRLQQKISGAKTLFHGAATHHSNCFRSIPPASALCGSNASHPSIRAHASAFIVLTLKAENSKLVRPEQGGPKISVSAPRGNPPANASTSEMPVGTFSAWRSRMVKGAGTRPARQVQLERNSAARFAGIAGPMGSPRIQSIFAFCSPLISLTSRPMSIPDIHSPGGDSVYFCRNRKLPAPKRAASTSAEGWSCRGLSVPCFSGRRGHALFKLRSHIPLS